MAVHVGARGPGHLSRSFGAAGGLASATLSNSAILDKSATWTKVGQLSGNGGTWTLTNNASGHFVVTAAGELRVGLVTPDRGSATSHSITVRETVSGQTVDTILTIAVTAITVATVGSGGAIGFPRRNGETAQNAVATTAGLYGLFGSNTAGGADGTLLFFWDVRRGSLVTQSSDADINNSPYIWGTGSQTIGRSICARYFPEDSSTATGTALKGRICFAGKDHSSANNLGNYAAADADGSPSGFASASFIRSVKVNDDRPRLVILRYTKTGATWNGVSVPGLSHQVVTIPLDTMIPEYGDVATHATWVGIGTSGSKTPNLAVGTYNTASSGAATVLATASIVNYFPGRVSDWAYVSVAASDTDIVSIAKGVSPVTQFGNAAVLYWWPLSSNSDLAQSAAATAQQVSSSMSVTGTVTTTQQMRPSINGSGNGLICLGRGDGNGFGLSPFAATTANATSATITQKAYIIGATSHIQARVTRLVDAATIIDWARVSGSAVNGLQTFSISGVPIGWDYTVELRREDDNTIVAVNRERIRVGFKGALDGQSQDAISTLGSGGAGTGVSVPAVANLSFCIHRPANKKARNVDVGVLEAGSDIANSMLAMMERLGTICPSIPWMFQLHAQSGESLGSFYTDQVTFAKGNGGDGTYKMVGDYSTPGSGLVTDVMLTGGKDIAFFLHMHGTADSGRASTYASLLNALFGGVSDGNEVFSNTPSNASVTQSNVITAGSISGTTMTVTTVTAGALLTPNLILSGGGVTANTTIVSQLTNTDTGGNAGKTGTYQVDTSQTVTFSAAVSAAATDPDSLTKTTSVVRNYTAAGLTYPIVVAMVPIQRHADVGTGGGASAPGHATFMSNYQTLRQVQYAWVPPNGITAKVACFTHDIRLASSIDTAHQDPTEVRGNQRIDTRYAMGMLNVIGLSTYNPNTAPLSASRAGNVITVSFNLLNGGNLFTPATGAPVGFELSEDGGTTWHAWNEGGDALGSNPGTTTAAIFTAAISGNTVTLTRKTSTWAANTRVRFMYGGPVSYFSIAQTGANRVTNYGYENTDNDNILYETRTDAAPSNGSGIVQGVPIMPTFSDLVAA